MEMLKALLVLILAGCPSSVFGQAPGVEIFDQSSPGRKAGDKALGEQLEELVEAEKLLSRDTIGKLLEDPTPRAVSFPVVATKELSPEEVADLARRRNFRVGWAYICTKCDNWHFNVAGGYAVAENGVVVTCAHVVKLGMLPKEVKKATLIAVDSEDKVHPITGVLANHAKMDVAVLTIDAATTPYALNEEVGPGDAAYCFSSPLGQGDYFSAGIVNRFYWNRSPEGDEVFSLSNLAGLKLNVSCRWAPGSSGSPVLDRFGNAIGHVARIKRLKEKGADDSKDGTMITLHSAVPARSIRALLLKQE